MKAPDRPARRTGAPTLLTGTMAAWLLLAACGSDGDDASSGADGGQLYAGSCAACHGSDLRGTSVGPSLLSIVYEPDHHPDASFRAAIANGVQAHHWQFGAMPPIAGLSDADVTAIIEYVRAVQAREGFEPYPPG